jgi:hypothetical protein
MRPDLLTRASVLLAVLAACGDATAPDNATAPGDGADPGDNPGAQPGVEITTTLSELRQGDVVGLAAEVRDVDGAVVDDPTVSWSLEPASSGRVTAEGRLVGYAPGPLRVVATVGQQADSLDLEITARGLGGAFTVVGQGTLTTRFTSDLWVHGTAAYTGTWGRRSTDVTRFGNTLYVWDVQTPAQSALVDSILIAAATVNDVKVRADGAIAVITHEGSGDGLNGITLLDLQDPLHPTVITRFTTDLEAGVHNVWIEGDHVYAAVDGTGGLVIVDIGTPQAPQRAGSFYAGSSNVHDVYVRDGLAFVSHWNVGLIILDVGHGIAGGSPGSPVEVSRIATAGGQAHNAWYWPATGYVFVGEEDFLAPGVLHVVDASDLANPVEVATFRVADEAPHNFWLDEAQAVLYAAWYSKGMRAVDVSGELLGELERQGREIAASIYGGEGGCPAATGTATCTWAPQVHDGQVYLSDMNTGLWVLQPTF